MSLEYGTYLQEPTMANEKINMMTRNMTRNVKKDILMIPYNDIIFRTCRRSSTTNSEGNEVTERVWSEGFCAA